MHIIECIFYKKTIHASLQEKLKAYVLTLIFGVIYLNYIKRKINNT